MSLKTRGPDGRFLSGDCERDCARRCAYPGQFSECDMDLSSYLSTPSDPEDIHESDLVAGEEVVADDPDSRTPTHVENDPKEDS